MLAERQPVKVSCLRYTGPFGEPLMRFWRAKVGPWLADHGLVDCPRYGMTLDDPATTPPERCRYDACVELPAGLSLPDAADAVIPGGTYAITPFKGTAIAIGPAWGQFVAAAFADPHQRFDAGRHPFEHYPRGASFDPRSGIFSCELCLPLLPPPVAP